MEHLAFLIKQKLYSLKCFLRDIPFNIKLQYLIWKYKGGENIPGYELKGMINVDHDDTFHKAVMMVSSLKEVCTRLNIDETKTLSYMLMSLYIRNESTDKQTDEMVGEFLSKTPRRKAAYIFLLENKDIHMRQVHFKIPESEFYQFSNWLNETDS